MDANTLAIVLGLAALVVIIALAAALYAQRRKSRTLRAHYGSEYAATIEQLGDRRKAEAELRRREKRVQALDIRPLAPGEIERFFSRWTAVQAEFVDDPAGAIGRADALLAEVMRARGYPVSDFEQRAADLSVDHAELVSNYRMAHDLAARRERGEASTEDLRQAMIHHRALFDELLEPAADAPRRPEERRSFERDETDDERAARRRDQDLDPRSDGRAAGEGPRPDRRASH
jgi:hypothetical protein